MSNILACSISWPKDSYLPLFLTPFRPSAAGPSRAPALRRKGVGKRGRGGARGMAVFLQSLGKIGGFQNQGKKAIISSFREANFKGKNRKTFKKQLSAASSAGALICLASPYLLPCFAFLCLHTHTQLAYYLLPTTQYLPTTTYDLLPTTYYLLPYLFPCFASLLCLHTLTHTPLARDSLLPG